MKQIASFGCGVDSVAMVLLKPDYDEIIFADTGSEMPETYAFLDSFEKKSGCFFCMFQKPKAWLNLKQTHPQLWEKAKALEKNSTMKLPLINLKGKDSQTLFECGCFNG